MGGDMGGPGVGQSGSGFSQERFLLGEIHVISGRHGEEVGKSSRVSTRGSVPLSYTI